MAKPSWFAMWVAGLAASSCATNDHAWNGTYSIATSGDTCHPSDASSIAFADNTVGVG